VYASTLTSLYEQHIFHISEVRILSAAFKLLNFLLTT
jgi:hypothetical protein